MPAETARAPPATSTGKPGIGIIHTSAQCKRHHHAKHAPGWKLQQPQPGVMRWTTPSGRTYTTHPTQYED
jgi:hypothetical protein